MGLDGHLCVDINKQHLIASTSGGTHSKCQTRPRTVTERRPWIVSSGSSLMSHWCVFLGRCRDGNFPPMIL